jgi:hypothetical protein
MKGARFARVHICDRFSYMERESYGISSGVLAKQRRQHICPELGGADYIPIDGHLSDAAARRIANALAPNWGRFAEVQNGFVFSEPAPCITQS